MPDNIIRIDDGTREYVLKNQFDQEIAKIHFRPADFSIVDRYNAMMRDFAGIVEPLKDISLKNDGTAAFDEDWATLKRVEADLMAKIGGLFDLDDVTAIFSQRNAFSPIGGEFYCFRVLTALQGVVTAAVEQEAKLSAERMAKYTADIDGDAGAASEGA